MYKAILDALAPVFLAIAVGALLRHLRFLPDAFFWGLNKLAFWVCLPCLLFREIARCRVPGGAVLASAELIALVAVPVLALAWLVMRLLRTPPDSRGAFLQGAVRGNLAYVGIPVIVFALARNPQAAGIAALVMAPITPLYNVLGVLLLTRHGAGQGSTWRRLGCVLRAVFTNPLILACGLGLLAFGWQVSLPSVLDKTVDMLGKAGLPMALLALGASLSFERVRGHFLLASVAALLRVAVAPLIGWWLAGWFGLTADLRTLTLLFLACPTAVASYVMADQMGADKDLAGAIVVLSTLYAFPAMALVLILAS